MMVTDGLGRLGWLVVECDRWQTTGRQTYWQDWQGYNYPGQWKKALYIVLTYLICYL